MNVTRRNFVSGATMGVAATALAGGSMMATAAEAPSPEAPSAAANDALAANVNVLGSMEPAAQAYEADIVIVGAGPAFFAEWLEAVHYHCDHEVLSTYLRNCGRVADWLMGHGFEFYMKEERPTNGLSGNEYRISQPKRDSGVRETAYGSMIDKVLKAGGEVVFNTVAQELIVDEAGVVAGVRAEAEDGDVVDFMAPAVVLASGGYAGNQAMVNALCNPPLLGRDPVKNCGEGAKMAWAAGAMKPWNLGILCCDTLYPIDENYASYADGIQGLGNVMGDFGKARLHVNQQSKRFHSEDAFCWMPTYGGANGVAGNEPWLYVVADQAVMDEFMSGDAATLDEAGLEDLIAAGVAFKTDTLAELAEAMGVADPAVLEQTVAAYNECCANGEDPVFCKKAELLVPLSEEGPFYAARFAPTPFGSCGDLSGVPTVPSTKRTPWAWRPGVSAFLHAGETWVSQNAEKCRLGHL